MLSDTFTTGRAVSKVKRAQLECEVLCGRQQSFLVFTYLLWCLLPTDRWLLPK